MGLSYHVGLKHRLQGGFCLKISINDWGVSVLRIKHSEFFPFTPSCVFPFFYSSLESAIVENANINCQAASLVSAIFPFLCHSLLV